MKAIIIGLGAVFFYGVMVGIKSLYGMFKYDRSCWPLAFGYLAYLLFVPLTFFIPDLYPSVSDMDSFEEHSLWKVCLLLLMVFMWLILGFAIKASYQRIITGESYWKPKAAAKKRIMVGAGSLAVGGAVWFTGLSGHITFLTGWWEKSAIILSIYLMVQGFILILRNLKYVIKDQPPERVKTVYDDRPKKSAKKSGKPAAAHISYKGQKKKKTAEKQAESAE